MSLPKDLSDPRQLGFDPETLTRRYRDERDKRVRSDNAGQFVEVSATNKYARYLLDDHFAAPAKAREPLTDDVEFLVIGGGWAGLMMAARLKQAGVTDVRIIEAGADFGGTWYWNRYPGAQCDVQSYVYMPLLEETGYTPKERYSYAPELLEHAQRIGVQYDLYPNAVFQTWVSEVRWDEEQLRWIVSTNRGDRMRAQFVGFATGPASRPRLPGIPGIDTFKGHSFHTSRWDYDYTGGGPDGGLEKLSDKRVAVIGTGATAIQCVSHVGASAKHTYVFQRTPSSVWERGNGPTDMEWIKSLKPGWQRKMMAAFDSITSGGAVDERLLETETMLRPIHHIRTLMAKVDPSTLTPEELLKIVELGGFASAEEIRKRVETTVHDHETAEKLKHWYYPNCKRPTFNDEYLQTFNRANVTLVDVSDSKGIDHITERGVVANGVEYEVDCIVYASGFEISSDFQKRIGIPVYGQGGKSLYEHWGKGMRSMFGMLVHGFPNLFLVGGLFNFTLSMNYSGTLDDQTDVLAKLVCAIRERGVAAQPSAEGEESWIAEQISSPPTPYSMILGGGPEICTPGYYNQEGSPQEQRRDFKRESYSPGASAYSAQIRTWVKGNLGGLEFL